MSNAMDSALADMDVLAYARRKRIALVEGLMPDDIAFSSADPKVLKVALAALDGLDRQELGMRKIDAGEKGAAANRHIAEALTNLLTNGLAGVHPFEAGGGGNVPDDRVVPLPQISIGELTLLPGETDIGTSDDNLLTFAGRTGIRTDTIAGAESADTVSEYAPREDTEPKDG